MENNIERIKKGLSDELINCLRQCQDDSVLDELVSHGYSSSEIMEMITKYDEKSGADIIFCTNVVKKSLVKSREYGVDKNSDGS